MEKVEKRKMGRDRHEEVTVFEFR